MKYLILLFALASCSTAKELLDKAEKKDPAIVAQYARDKYPCTDLLKPDTAIVYQDSLIFVDVECPEVGQPAEVLRIDTVNNIITRTVRVPVNMPVQTKVITKWYEDSAKLKLYRLQVEGLQKDTATLRAARDTYQAKAQRRGKENWIWRAIATVLILWKAFKLYKRLTTIKVT